MAEGKQRNDWERHSSLLCLIANVNRPPNKAAFTPDQFNPFKVKKAGSGLADFKQKLGIGMPGGVPLVKVGKGTK